MGLCREVALRDQHRRLAAQHAQEDAHALRRRHAGDQAGVTGERTPCNLHSISTLPLGQGNETIGVLTAAQLLDRTRR